MRGMQAVVPPEGGGFGVLVPSPPWQRLDLAAGERDRLPRDHQGPPGWFPGNLQSRPQRSRVTRDSPLRLQRTPGVRFRVPVYLDKPAAISTANFRTFSSLQKKPMYASTVTLRVPISPALGSRALSAKSSVLHCCVGGINAMGPVVTFTS
ncbi:hypothetical protein AAY473_035891 [Plecturocebus cupreus]